MVVFIVVWYMESLDTLVYSVFSTTSIIHAQSRYQEKFISVDWKVEQTQHAKHHPNAT